MPQSHLNGAYYGPPIPPKRSYRSIGGGRSCCYGGCCCCECLFSCIFKILLSIIVTVGIIVLIIWLIFRPSKITAHVDSASLSNFSLSSTTNSSLQYDLTLNISVRNPNKRIGIYYDYIEAEAYYDESRFGSDTLAPFYTHPESTGSMDPVFRGTQPSLGSAVGTTYKRETSEGYYYVDVKIDTKLRLKIWVFKIHHVNPTIDCSLKLPAPGNSGSAPFEGTDCDVSLW